MSVDLHIEDYQQKPFPFVLYEETKEIYSSLVKFISSFSRLILTFILLITSPIWATILFLLLISARIKTKRKYTLLAKAWMNAPRSAAMFDVLEKIIQYRQIMERGTGEFQMPKRFWMLRPFFWEIKNYYNLYNKQAIWLEQKLYPTAEELGIPSEDVEFMKAQMTKEDFEGLRDPDWFEFEKECIVNN